MRHLCNWTIPLRGIENAADAVPNAPFRGLSPSLRGRAHDEAPMMKPTRPRSESSGMLMGLFAIGDRSLQGRRGRHHWRQFKDRDDS